MYRKGIVTDPSPSRMAVERKPDMIATLFFLKDITDTSGEGLTKVTTNAASVGVNLFTFLITTTTCTMSSRVFLG